MFFRSILKCIWILLGELNLPTFCPLVPHNSSLEEYAAFVWSRFTVTSTRGWDEFGISLVKRPFYPCYEHMWLHLWFWSHFLEFPWPWKQNLFAKAFPLHMMWSENLCNIYFDLHMIIVIDHLFWRKLKYICVWSIRDYLLKIRVKIC